MNWYLIVKYLHIVAVILMIGGIFARQLVRGVAKKSDDVGLVASFTKMARRLDSIMVIPGSNATVILGVILALMVGLPILGFLQGATTDWLLVSNIMLVLVLGLVFGMFLPYNKKLDSIVQAALTEERVTPELRAALNDRTQAMAHHFEEIAILIIAALMALKPF
jgi:uncharacterized membrane protein